jgi:hypothetical protein
MSFSVWPYISESTEAWEREIVAEPLRGVRVWATGTSGILRSLSFPHVWGGGAPASCKDHTGAGKLRLATAKGGLVPFDPSLPPTPHEAPHAECGCGYWAFSERDKLNEALPAIWVWGSRPSLVTGEVLLWGRIIEHTHGYRAQFARPDGELTFHSVPPLSPGLQEHLRKEIMSHHPGTTVQFKCMKEEEL